MIREPTNSVYRYALTSGHVYHRLVVEVLGDEVLLRYEKSYLNAGSKFCIAGFSLICLTDSKMGELAETMQWTELMDQMMQELAARGHTPGAIMEAIAKNAPCPFAETFRRVMARGNIEAVIVSDANEHFINHYLSVHGLAGLISRVVSNKSQVIDGVLRVSAYHSHSCDRNEQDCAVNMCKGDIVEALLKETSYERVWYLGDGSGDFCPCKILLEAAERDNGLDVRIFCREMWSLHKRLMREYVIPMERAGDAGKVKRKDAMGRIAPWADYESLDRWFQV